MEHMQYKGMLVVVHKHRYKVYTHMCNKKLGKYRFEAVKQSKGKVLASSSMLITIKLLVNVKYIRNQCCM